MDIGPNSISQIALQANCGGVALQNYFHVENLVNLTYTNWQTFCNAAGDLVADAIRNRLSNEFAYVGSYARVLTDPTVPSFTATANKPGGIASPTLPAQSHIRATFYSNSHATTGRQRVRSNWIKIAGLAKELVDLNACSFQMTGDISTQLGTVLVTTSNIGGFDGRFVVVWGLGGPGVVGGSDVIEAVALNGSVRNLSSRKR